MTGDEPARNDPPSHPLSTDLRWIKSAPSTQSSTNQKLNGPLIRLETSTIVLNRPFLPSAYPTMQYRTEGPQASSWSLTCTPTISCYA